MATSNWQNISLCCELIYKISPRSVLDVGLNSVARWGVLVRDFADVWHGRVTRNEWQVQLDAIEAFPPNIHELHHLVYDRIYQGDALQVIDELGSYDLVILGDVIEHFPKADAVAFLHKCTARASYVLINTPGGTLKEWEQGAAYDNPYEEHHCIINRRDLKRDKRLRLLVQKKYKDQFGRDYWTYLVSRRDFSPTLKF